MIKNELNEYFSHFTPQELTKMDVELKPLREVLGLATRMSLRLRMVRNEVLSHRFELAFLTDKILRYCPEIAENLLKTPRLELGFNSLNESTDTLHNLKKAITFLQRINVDLPKLVSEN